jgi:DNA repair exonuclease SbcCD nuclease subunit
MPFLYPDTILDQSGRALQDVPEDQRILVSQAILKEFLQNSSKIESDAHILLAHYYFEGAEVSNSQYPEAEMGELEFNPSMIPENLDLAVFGHIHLYQEREARGVPIVFVGAVERIDWGEREGPKGFLAVNPTTLKPTFHELPTRDMLAFYVKIDEEETDPTSKILETLPADVAEKMIRLTVEIPLGARPLIRESRIAEKLDPAFDRKVVWRTQTPERIGVVEAGMALADHYGLLESFIDVTFAKHPHKEALAEEGRNILREVLES